MKSKYMKLLHFTLSETDSDMVKDNVRFILDNLDILGKPITRRVDAKYNPYMWLYFKSPVKFKIKLYLHGDDSYNKSEIGIDKLYNFNIDGARNYYTISTDLRSYTIMDFIKEYDPENYLSLERKVKLKKMIEVLC